MISLGSCEIYFLKNRTQNLPLNGNGRHLKNAVFHFVYKVIPRFLQTIQFLHHVPKLLMILSDFPIREGAEHMWGACSFNCLQQ